MPRSTFYYHLKSLKKQDKYKEIKEEITAIMNLALKSDMSTYLNWYYPQIKECFYIATRLNIYSFSEVDRLFFKIDKYIRSEITGGEQNV